MQEQKSMEGVHGSEVKVIGKRFVIIITTEVKYV